VMTQVLVDLDLESKDGPKEKVKSGRAER